MLGNIRLGNQVTNITNATRAFECHPGGEEHGKLLLTLAGAGVAANLGLASLVIARRALRRWSSGLLVHGTIVDGCRSALLVPLSLLSDAPLLPPPVLVPSLLRSAGFVREKRRKEFSSPLYPNKLQNNSYYSDYYDEDANLLAETTAMPDSPQCVLFGSFMVWFAALVINLGPTFLSGAIAAQAEIIPPVPSCPLVRGPARHVVLNILWASVNLLCVCLAASHLRKLKRDLGRARIGQLAAAGAGLASLAGIMNTNQNSPKPSSSKTPNNAQSEPKLSTRNLKPNEMDDFLRQAQKSGQYHIRTLGTLAILNLICWVPLYTCALIAPVGTTIWEDPISPQIYEITLMLTFAHSVLHPIFLLFLHQPLRVEFKRCLIDSCCCICICFGMDFGEANEDDHPSPIHERDYGIRPGPSVIDQDRESQNRSRPSSQNQLHSSTTESMLYGSRSMDNLSHKLRRESLTRSNRSLRDGVLGRSLSPLCLDEMEMGLGLPPPPLPPAAVGFRKQASMEDRSSSIMDNRW